MAQTHSQCAESTTCYTVSRSDGDHQVGRWEMCRRLGVGHVIAWERMRGLFFKLHYCILQSAVGLGA